jgi:hypothetical protein
MGGGVWGLGTTAARPRRADPSQGLAQPAFQEKAPSFVDSGVDITVQPVISADKQDIIGVSLNPVVQTLDKVPQTAPVIVNPVIPGGYQALLQ